MEICAQCNCLQPFSKLQRHHFWFTSGPAFAWWKRMEAVCEFGFKWMLSQWSLVNKNYTLKRIQNVARVPKAAVLVNVVRSWYYAIIDDLYIQRWSNPIQHNYLVVIVYCFVKEIKRTYNRVQPLIIVRWSCAQSHSLWLERQLGPRKIYSGYNILCSYMQESCRRKDKNWTSERFH